MVLYLIKAFLFAGIILKIHLAVVWNCAYARSDVSSTADAGQGAQKKLESTLGDFPTPIAVYDWCFTIHVPAYESKHRSTRRRCRWNNPILPCMLKLWAWLIFPKRREPWNRDMDDMFIIWFDIVFISLNFPINVCKGTPNIWNTNGFPCFLTILGAKLLIRDAVFLRNPNYFSRMLWFHRNLSCLDMYFDYIPVYWPIKSNAPFSLSLIT